MVEKEKYLKIQHVHLCTSSKRIDIDPHQNPHTESHRVMAQSRVQENTVIEKEGNMIQPMK